MISSLGAMVREGYGRVCRDDGDKYCGGWFRSKAVEALKGPDKLDIGTGIGSLRFLAGSTSGRACFYQLYATGHSFGGCKLRRSKEQLQG